MKLAKLLELIILITLGTSLALAQPLSPSLSSAAGKWRTTSGSAVETWIQDGKLFGKMIESAPKGKTMCDWCSGDQKGKSIIGVIVIGPLAADGDAWTNGSITDPETGKVYKAKVKANGDELLVRGFIGFSMIGRTETWKRIK